MRQLYAGPEPGLYWNAAPKLEVGGGIMLPSDRHVRQPGNLRMSVYFLPLYEARSTVSRGDRCARGRSGRIGAVAAATGHRRWRVQDVLGRDEPAGNVE